MKVHTGRPRVVLDKILTNVRAYVDRPDTVAFKIGRTNDPIRREATYRHEHGSKVWLYPVYETTSLRHAMDVEESLIRALFAHSKSRNIAAHAGGAIADGVKQWVYLAMGPDLR